MAFHPKRGLLSSLLTSPLETLRVALYGRDDPTDPRPKAKRQRPYRPFANTGIPSSVVHRAARDEAFFNDPRHLPAPPSAAEVRRYVLAENQRGAMRPPPVTASRPLRSNWKEGFRRGMKKVYGVSGKGSDAIDDDARDDGHDAQDDGGDDEWFAGAEAALDSATVPLPNKQVVPSKKRKGRTDVWSEGDWAMLVDRVADPACQKMLSNGKYMVDWDKVLTRGTWLAVHSTTQLRKKWDNRCKENSDCVLAAHGKNSKGTAACLTHGGGRCQANSDCVLSAQGTNRKGERACITHGGIAAEHPRPPAPGAYAAAQRALAQSAAAFAAAAPNR